MNVGYVGFGHCFQLYKAAHSQISTESAFSELNWSCFIYYNSERLSVTVLALNAAHIRCDCLI